MDTISRLPMTVKHVLQSSRAKWVKLLWYGGQQSKYKYGEAWQIDYIVLLQSRQGKCFMLTVLEGTTGCLETYPMPHSTAQNTIWALKNKSCGNMALQKELSQNSLVDIWAREYEIEWVYHIP